MYLSPVQGNSVSILWFELLFSPTIVPPMLVVIQYFHSNESPLNLLMSFFWRRWLMANYSVIAFKFALQFNLIFHSIPAYMI